MRWAHLRVRSIVAVVLCSDVGAHLRVCPCIIRVVVGERADT